ncbi:MULTISPECIES: hypothetical protein [unclassified Nocardioides]|uniref:hypothetical protein n=1 Tax=unclassified Nocardioides TaxID=2615069 RepID=UPI00114FBBB5|nr:MULTISPECIES: hypothetical protein [unclassified Nocardioides]TQK71907.1 hypothetical protein FBY23_3712 [Nocardioides sp. SLBN-35]WGY03897.1 hypothetical protein QI633_09030 [Nocardioides sp. QY071]
MREPSRPPLPLGALFILPTLLFWILVIRGATSGDEGDAGRYAGYAFGIAGVTLAIFAFFKIRQVRARNADERRAVRDGIRTTARIVSTRVKGHLNQDPYVVFELEVTPETGAPYRTSVTELVSQLAIPRIQPDAVVDVHVHPDDDRFVVIDPVALGR